MGWRDGGAWARGEVRDAGSFSAEDSREWVGKRDEAEAKAA